MGFRLFKKKIPIVILLVGIFLVSCQESSTPDGQSANTKVSALDSINNLIQKDKHNPKLLSQRATLYLSENHLDKAIDDMALAVKLDSENVDYQIALSQYYLLNAQSEKTKEILEKAAKQFPKEPKVFIELGKLYLYVKDYTKAKNFLNRVLELDATNAYAFYFKAVIAVEEKKPETAKRFLLSAVENNPDFLEAYKLLGQVAYDENDSLSIDYYKTACKLNPTDINIRYALGMAQQRNGHPVEAINTYEYILNHLDSSYVDAYYNIGYLILTESTHPLASKEYFQKVLAMDSLRYDAWTNLGIVAKKEHQQNLAIQYFKKALALKPNFEPAVKNLNAIEK